MSLQKLECNLICVSKKITPKFQEFIGDIVSSVRVHNTVLLVSRFSEQKVSTSPPGTYTYSKQPAIPGVDIPHQAPSYPLELKRKIARVQGDQSVLWWDESYYQRVQPIPPGQESQRHKE